MCHWNCRSIDTLSFWCDLKLLRVGAVRLAFVFEEKSCALLMCWGTSSPQAAAIRNGPRSCKSWDGPDDAWPIPV